MVGRHEENKCKTREATEAWSGTRRRMRGVKNKNGEESCGKGSEEDEERKKKKEQQQKDVRLEETAQV